ncbi:unnamed protein product, partial [Amoebophrya sp. A25]
GLFAVPPPGYTESGHAVDAAAVALASTTSSTSSTTAKPTYTAGFLNPPHNTVEARYEFGEFRLKLAEFFLYGPLQIGTNMRRFEHLIDLNNIWFQAGIDISFSTFAGVNNGTLYCYLALECQVDVDGVGLSTLASNMGLMIVHRDQQCYSTTKEPIAISNMKNPTDR